MTKDDAIPPRPSEWDFEADPLLRLERNNRSTRQAIWFFVSVIVLSAAAAVLITLASRVMGGQDCRADASAIICSQNMRILFAIIPSIIAACGLFGGVWITYLKWRSHQRWRPWIAVVWFIMPYALGWIITGGTIVILR